MYETINGWTKESMKEAIRKYNNGTRAVDPCTDICEYFSDGGNRCAVGCFIPEQFKEAVRKAGGASAQNLLVYNSFVPESFVPGLIDHMPIDPEGLMEMQSIHDDFGDDPATDVRDALDNWIDENVTEAANV